MSHLLKTLLRDCKLDGVGVGESRAQVLDTFGIPDSWEGQPNLAHSDSAVWVYDHVQFFFDNECVARIAIYFDSRRKAVDCSRSTFDDVNFSPRTTIDEFSDYLSDHGFAFRSEQGEYGKMLIRIPPSIIATFKHKTDFDKSTVAEERISFAEAMLVSIVVQ